MNDNTVTEQEAQEIELEIKKKDNEALVELVRNLAALVKVKTVVTLTLTGVFSYLAIIGRVEPKDFLTVFLMVISFYFGTQMNK